MWSWLGTWWVIAKYCVRSRDYFTVPQDVIYLSMLLTNKWSYDSLITDWLHSCWWNVRTIWGRTFTAGTGADIRTSFCRALYIFDDNQPSLRVGYRPRHYRQVNRSSQQSQDATFASENSLWLICICNMANTDILYRPHLLLLTFNLQNEISEGRPRKEHRYSFPSRFRNEFYNIHIPARPGIRKRRRSLQVSAWRRQISVHHVKRSICNLFV